MTRRVSRCVAFLIRTKKQLRRKFDFRRSRSPAFVLSNRDGLLRDQSSGVGGRCTLKVHLLTARIPNTRLMPPSSLHRIEYIGQNPSRFVPPLVLRTRQSRTASYRLSKRRVRALGRFFIAIIIGVGATLAWQSYGGEMVRAWVPSLGWLLPASLTAELQTQVKPVALDLAIMRRSVEQLASNQDQLARKQDQMAQAFAILQSAVRDINQNILALAPLAPKAAHIVPAKPPQTPAQ